MAEAATALEERFEYLLDLPLHVDFCAAVDCATDHKAAEAFEYQARWLGECAVALQQLAKLAEQHDIELNLDDHAEPRVVGPCGVLDELDFLYRAPLVDAFDEEDPWS